MAETKVINLEVKTNADETAKSFIKVSDAVVDVNDGIKDLGRSSGNAEGGLKKVSKGITAIGLSFKAAGIGLVISAFVMLKEVFSQNQKVADALSSGMETVSIVFNEVARVVSDVYTRVDKATGGFNALGKVIGGLITIALSPLKAAFYGIKLGVQEVQLIWEKSFFGNKDQANIKNLQKEIKLTQNDIANVGKGVVKAGKDIGNNFVEAVGEVGSFVSETAKGISDISIKAAFEQAKLNVEIQNQAKIAAAQQSILIEKYDRAAEKLRQVRDEERNSIDERIKANNDLGAVLEKQQKALLRQADLQVQAAKNDVNKSNNIENQVKLLETQANREGILSQIEGFRSEQLVNDLALNREKQDLIQSSLESETNLSIEQKRFNAERIKGETAKLEELKKVINEEKDIELKRLQTKIDTYKEGTQARLDAEIEYNTIKQQLDNEVNALEDQQRAIRSADLLDSEKGFLQARITLNENDIQSKRDLLEVEKEILLQNTELTQGEIAAIEAKYRADREQLDKDEIAKKKVLEGQKLQAVQDTFSTIANLVELFAGKSRKQQETAFKIQKAANIANATIDTYKSATGAYSSLASIPVVGPALGIAAAGAALTAGLLNVKKIASTKFDSGGTTGGGGSTPSTGGGGSTPQSVITPNFNIVGNNGTNQLKQLQQAPIQAYVVSGEMSTQQSLDRNRLRNATL